MQVCMPENQKAENLLNLSLDAGEKERLSSPVLAVGTDADNEQWEVIVKYHGDITGVASEEIKVEILSAGYAIITLPRRYIEALAALDEIEFLEKPKRLFYEDAAGNFASCRYTASGPGNIYTGSGVCIGVIDSGLSFELPAFRNRDGSSRVLFYLDLVQQREYNKEELDQILQGDNEGGYGGMRPTPDISGHGTCVTAIAAGNGKGRDGSVDTNLIGMAPEASLIVVKLDTGANSSFPLTTSLMRALDYVVNKAVELRLPLAVNLSFGNTYGPHDGTSLIERFVDDIAEIGRTVICVGSGNEGAAGGHTGGIVSGVESERKVEFVIASYEREFNLQIWLNFTDRYAITLGAPGGETFTFETENDRERTLRWTVGDTNLLIYVGVPQPYSVNREIFIDYIPEENYVNQGLWSVIFSPLDIKSGNYSMYMPSSQVKGSATRFLQPVPEQTLTIPSTAERVITVGAYNSTFGAYADFSGRGYVTRLSEGYIHVVKPEIVAPGVGILAENETGLQRLDGTSYATPFVTGASALLMGKYILSGEDPYLYGEKMKAKLCTNAKELNETEAIPNEKTGWGGLCLSDF